MATVRELTTRFNFQTDKRGLNEFREGILGAKSAIAGLVGALGLGVIAKSILSAGDNLKDAAILAGQFTDEVRLLDGVVSLVGDMADAWERVQKAIPGRETMGEFLTAFALFRQTFKDAPLADFEVFFELAGNLSRITGRPLLEMFDVLHQSIVSGDFAALAELLPTFDAADAAMANFVRRLIEVDPTQVQTVEQRMRAIRDLGIEVNPALAETGEKIMELTTAGQWEDLKRNMGAVAEIIGNMDSGLTDVLATANEFMNVWIDGGVTIRSFRDAFQQIFDVELPDFIVRSLRGISRFLQSPLTLFEDLAAGGASFFERGEEFNRALFPTVFNRPRSLEESLSPAGRGALPAGGPRLGFLSGVGVFAPTTTIILNGDTTDAQIRRIQAAMDERNDQAIDQFPQQEAVEP